MITEDYVSFEVAKLLKEKGFDENCVGYYPRGKNTEINHSFLYERNSDWIDNSISAPTLQMAMKWLREVHKINLHLVPFYGFNREYTDNCKWIYGIDFENKGISLNYPKFNSYEEACEAAIKYCLTNLI